MNTFVIVLQFDSLRGTTHKLCVQTYNVKFIQSSHKLIIQSPYLVKKCNFKLPNYDADNFWLYSLDYVVVIFHFYDLFDFGNNLGRQFLVQYSPC